MADDKNSRGGPIPCRDHLGNEFPSIAAMLRRYGLNEIQWRWRRVKQGWSIEKTLTTPIIDTRKTNAQKCKDHLGNEYESKAAMCDAYRIPRQSFFQRLRDGWTVERALTEPISKVNRSVKMIKAPNGKKYRNLDDMCKAYDITKAQYMTNIRNGLSVKRALAERTEPLKCPRDHLGNEFKSVNELCRAYGIKKDRLRCRIELGWTLREILENPENVEQGKRCVDHEGREFKSEKDMAEFHGVRLFNFKYRRKKGMPLEKCLNPENQHTKQATDHHGGKFNHVTDMLKWWDSPPGTYHKALGKGLDARTAILGQGCITHPLPDGMISTKLTDNGYYYIAALESGSDVMISDITLHAMIRKKRVDEYLKGLGPGNIKNKAVFIEKIGDYYEIEVISSGEKLLLSSDNMFRLIFMIDDGLSA